MKILMKLLSYIKYTLIPPFVVILVWASHFLVQSILRFMIAFVMNRQFLEQLNVLDKDNNSELMLNWFIRNFHILAEYVLDFIYYLNYWLPVEFILTTGMSMILISISCVFARLSLKIFTLGQF